MLLIVCAGVCKRYAQAARRDRRLLERALQQHTMPVYAITIASEHRDAA